MEEGQCVRGNVVEERVERVDGERILREGRTSIHSFDVWRGDST